MSEGRYDAIVIGGGPNGRLRPLWIWGSLKVQPTRCSGSPTTPMNGGYRRRRANWCLPIASVADRHFRGTRTQAVSGNSEWSPKCVLVRFWDSQPAAQEGRPAR